MAVGGEIVDKCIDAKSEKYLCFLKLLQDDANRPKGDLAPAVLVEKENGPARTGRPLPGDPHYVINPLVEIRRPNLDSAIQLRSKRTGGNF